MPKEAACAQSRFDCWIRQQAKNEIIACKGQFMEALNKLGSVSAPPPADVMPPVEAGQMPLTPMAPEDAKYLVFFGTVTLPVSIKAVTALSIPSQPKSPNKTSLG